MKVYEKNEFKRIVCNKCGHIISDEGDFLKEDYFSANKIWGYFSDKDGVSHSFDLCEKCYDTMIKNFLIPITEEEMTELI